MSRFILFLFLWLCAFPTAARTILVLGDSLSAGYGLRQSEAWPALLAQRLRQERLDYEVANASISGDTTAGGRSRLEAALRQHRPQVLILALGANDGLRGLPLDAMRANLSAMVEAAQHAGAKVLLVGMRLPPNYGPDYTEKFHAAFGEVARTRRAALVDFLLDGFAEKRELFQADGIHPTSSAQPLIVNNVWPALRPLLTPPARRK